MYVPGCCCCCCCCQVTGTLLKGYRARFKGAPLSSTVNYLKQYVAVSAAQSDYQRRRRHLTCCLCTAVVCRGIRRIAVSCTCVQTSQYI
jgi:hypothetical protein